MSESLFSFRAGFFAGVICTAGLVVAILEPWPISLIGWIGEALLVLAALVFLRGDKGEAGSCAKS